MSAREVIAAIGHAKETGAQAAAAADYAAAEAKVIGNLVNLAIDSLGDAVAALQLVAEESRQGSVRLASVTAQQRGEQAAAILTQAAQGGSNPLPAQAIARYGEASDSAVNMQTAAEGLASDADGHVASIQQIIGLLGTMCSVRISGTGGEEGSLLGDAMAVKTHVLGAQAAAEGYQARL